MRKKIIAGNWKMNPAAFADAMQLVVDLKNLIKNPDCDVVFCVPAPYLLPVAESLRGTGIDLGAQNMFYENSGAYTGETSARMIKDMGAKYVIIGHSERRAYFGETDEIVNKKVLKAIESGLIPIICVGETLEQRDQGITIDLVRMQTKIALKDVPGDKVNVVVAYEPVWAIGTGRTATSEQAEEVCAAIRQVLGELYCNDMAAATRIQYGGSVTPENAAELFSMPNIDGGLVGGASLKPTFERIVNYGG